MATIRWRGDAQKVAQVDLLTVGGTVEAGDIFIVTINGKTVTVVATTTSTTTTATEIYTALAASEIPEFLEITWTNPSAGVVKGTAVTAGKPFTVTATTTETGGGGADSQTFVRSASVANSGPNVVSVAANWVEGVAPADGDDIVIDQGTVENSLLYDLDQNGVTPASITVLEGFKGYIGLPVINSDDPQNTYFEYRETYLKYGTSGDATNIAVTIRSTAQRIKYSAGSSQATFRVDGTGQSIEDGVPCCLLKGTHASTALHVSRGDVGVAFFAGETSTLVTLNVGYQTNVSSDASVKLGSGVTLTAPTIVQTGGTLEVNSAITSTSTVTIYDGVYRQLGTGGIAAGLTVRGGTCIYSTNGTLGGAPVVSGEGHLDFSQDLRTKAVTNPVDVYGDKARVSDPNRVISTLVVDLDETANSENINFGRNVRLTRGSVA